MGTATSTLITLPVLPAKVEFTVDALDGSMDIQTSKAGNPFWSFDQLGVNLPDGIDSTVTVLGQAIEFGEVEVSKKSTRSAGGNRYRSGRFDAEIAGSTYVVKATLVDGKMPTGVFVSITRKPDPSARLLKPRGGTLG